MKAIAILILMGFPLAVPTFAETATPPIHPKLSFAQKHPRLHKAGRRLRRTCVVLQPLVSFGGAVAQIVTAIK